MTTDTIAVERSLFTPIIAEGAGVRSSTGQVEAADVASFTTAVSHVFIDASPSPADRVGAALYSFAKRLRGLPNLRAIVYAHEGGVQLVWTFIERRDKAVRRTVYEAERRLMDECPDLAFDFNVISLDQYHDRSLLADDVRGSIVFYRHG